MVPKISTEYKTWNVDTQSDDSALNSRQNWGAVMKCAIIRKMKTITVNNEKNRWTFLTGNDLKY